MWFLNILSNGGGGLLRESSGEKMTGSFLLFGCVIFDAGSHPLTSLQEAMIGMLLFRTVTELFRVSVVIWDSTE